MNIFKVYNILLILSVISGIFFQITGIQYFLYIFVILGLACFAIVASDLKHKDIFVIAISIYLSYCILFEIVKNGSVSTLDNVLMVFASAGLALVLQRHIPSRRIILTVYLAVLGWFLIYLVIGGSISDNLANNFLHNKSRNHVSILFIYMAALVLISVESRGRAAVLVCAATLTVSVVAVGRSGIVASALLLAGVALSQWRIKSIFRLALITLSLVGLYVVVSNMQILPDKIMSFEKFDKEIGMDPRIYIIKTYISQLDVETISFGFKSQEQARVSGSLTLHNSYLALHFRFGLLGLLFTAVMVLLVIKGLLEKRVQIRLSAIILLALMIRGFTDVMFIPNGMFDFIMLYLMSSIYNKNIS